MNHNVAAGRKDDIYEKAYLVHCVLISCLLCGCIRRDRTLDSQLMDSREVDFSEENENNKKILQNSGKKVMTFQ